MQSLEGWVTPSLSLSSLAIEKRVDPEMIRVGLGPDDLVPGRIEASIEVRLRLHGHPDVIESIASAGVGPELLAAILAHFGWKAKKRT